MSRVDPISKEFKFTRFASDLGAKVEKAANAGHKITDSIAFAWSQSPGAVRYLTLIAAQEASPADGFNPAEQKNQPWRQFTGQQRVLLELMLLDLVDHFCQFSALESESEKFYGALIQARENRAKEAAAA